MATERNVVDFKIHNLTEEQFQELKAQGKIDPNAVYCTPDTTKERLDALETKTTSLEENKQDIATAVNYDNITNCLTEIPQDIKLELVDGTLTLKAGSKVYVPNGAGVFDEVTIANDISNSGNAAKSFAITDGSSLLWTNNVSSGGTAPANPSNGQIWYDTTNNVVKRYSTGSGTWVGGFSLPVALLNLNVTTLTTITEMQVFNGFGYIGSTIFALPGVKGLAPNGRNEDGSLKNIEFATSMVLTATDASTATNVLVINSGSISRLSATNYFYDEQKNIIINKHNDAQMLSALYGFNKTNNGIVSEFATKPTFHAVDYSDFEELDNSVVHKTGDETVAGIKTFASPTRKTTSLERGVVPSVNTNVQATRFIDKNSKVLGELEYFYGTNGKNGMSLLLYDSSGNRGAALGIGQNSDGTNYASAPTPASTSNGTDIATTAWSNAKFLQLTGGTMTGSITSETGTSNPAIKHTDGGQLWLMPISNTTYKGGFILRSRNSDGTFADLNGKNDGTLTWKGNQLATMPNYSAGVTFTLNKSTSYTAPKDGVVFILTGRANDQGSNIKINGTAVATTISNWSNIPYFFPVAKGTVVSTDYDTISTAIFYPLKGAN